MESKDLTVVIVTFKSQGIISKCIQSIPDYVKIIIVENSKNENFKKDLENKYQNVKCILAGQNKGYAAGNNIGLDYVKSKYALVLNPDTILHEDAIKNFFITANKINDFHLLGPASNQMVQIDFKKNNIVEVNNLKGFAIFFNIKKFNKNFFDENYFLFFEEIDLCKKVKSQGGSIYLDSKIKIAHEGASSVDQNFKNELEKNRNWHWMWSTFYYHKKYKGFIYALIIIFPKMFSSFFKIIFYSITLNKNQKEIYFCRLSGIFNSILGKKSWYRPTID